MYKFVQFFKVLLITPFKDKDKAIEYIEKIHSGLIQNDYDVLYYTITPTYIQIYDFKEIRYYKIKNIKNKIC